MAKRIVRSKGDRYRPIVTVLKVRGETPTVIEVSGRRYVMEHNSTWREKKEVVQYKEHNRRKRK